MFTKAIGIFVLVQLIILAISSFIILFIPFIILGPILIIQSLPVLPIILICIYVLFITYTISLELVIGPLKVYNNLRKTKIIKYLWKNPNRYVFDFVHLLIFIFLAFLSFIPSIINGSYWIILSIVLTVNFSLLLASVVALKKQLNFENREKITDILS